MIQPCSVRTVWVAVARNPVNGRLIVRREFDDRLAASMWLAVIARGWPQGEYQVVPVDRPI